MKYWVYKDARILGPFDKDAVAGFPGLDASTLVSAGESAGAEGAWRPAGDVSELSGLTSDRGFSLADDFSSTYGLLDKLQIDAAGLVGDDDFPGSAAAADLFQDAAMKQTFGDLLTPRPSVDEAELRRAKTQVSELTLQLEMLYQRVAELEAGQTNLVHRLAEKEMLLRRQPPPPTPPEIAAFLREAAAPPAPSPAPAPQAPPPAPVEPMTAAAAPAVPIPPIPAAPPAPQAAAPAAPAEVPPQNEWPKVEPAGALPNFGAAVPAAPAVPLPPAPEAPAPAAAEAPAAPAEISTAPKKAMFERKSFKIAPTVKSFRVVGPDAIPAAGSAAAPAPAPETSAEPVLPPAPAPAAAAGPAAAPFDWAASAPAPAAPAPAAAPEPAPISLQPVETSAPSPVFTPPPSEAAPAPETAGGPPTPMPAPPATLSFGVPPQPAFETQAMPSFSAPAGEASASAPSTQEVLARLGKPAPAPATAAPRSPRSNKTFVLAAGGLVIVMGVLGYLMLRHPKDLNQMARLDDGRARVGYAPVDDGSAPPMVKPRPIAQPEAAPAPAPVQTQAPASAPAAAEAPQAAAQSKLDAAVAEVKDFPLDGGRGTVASWLQYSYSASPDAGKESWSASETSPTTCLVEYRFTPSARGGAEVHYLFEADMDRGFVIGKNLDAKNMLAGGFRADEPKPKAKAKAKAKPKAKARKRPARVKRAAKRPVEEAQPKEVPQLPLPAQDELRPPAEDDGAFRADTVNSGL